MAYRRRKKDQRDSTPDDDVEYHDIKDYEADMAEYAMVSDEVLNNALNTFYEGSDDEDLQLNVDEDFNVETPAQTAPAYFEHALRGNVRILEDDVRFSRSLAKADVGPTETFTKLKAALKAEKEKKDNPGNFKDERPKRSNPFFNPGVSDPGPSDGLHLWNFSDLGKHKLPPPPSVDDDFTDSRARFTTHHHLYGKYILSEKTEIKNGVFECKVIRNPNRILPTSRNAAAAGPPTAAQETTIPQNAGGLAAKRVYLPRLTRPSKPPPSLQPMQMHQIPVAYTRMAYPSMHFRPPVIRIPVQRTGGVRVAGNLGSPPKTIRMEGGSLAYGSPSRGTYQPRAIPRIIRPVFSPVRGLRPATVRHVIRPIAIGSARPPKKFATPQFDSTGRRVGSPGAVHLPGSSPVTTQNLQEQSSGPEAKMTSIISRPETDLPGPSGAPRMVQRAQSTPRVSSAPQRTVNIARYVGGKMVITQGTREDMERLQRANASGRLISVDSSALPLASSSEDEKGGSSGPAENQ